MQLDFERARNEMVANQLQARGIRGPNVLEAMRSVPREMFLPLSLQKLAYEDAAIPIDEDRTVPQPYHEAAGRAIGDCRCGGLAGQRRRQLRDRRDRDRGWRAHDAELHRSRLNQAIAIELIASSA